MALDRIGDAAPMDELTYTYAPTDNRLQRVDDTVGNSDFGTDHDDMTTDFAYYRNGNLQNDPTANIANILWHPNGKLNAIIRDGVNESPTLVFSYDGLGNRVRKVQVARDASGNTLPMAQWDLTYYIRDAQGNHLTTIGRKMTETDEYEATDELNITETILYGSDRLGSRGWEPSDDGQPASLIGRQAFTHSGASTEGEYQDITLSGSPVYSTAPEGYFSSLEGAKHYELKNHLGNVLATVSDKRDVEVDGSNNVENYTAKISDVSFYYPFGSLMPGLSDFGGEHRFGFNGQEQVDEVKNVRGAHNTALFWEYDTRLARRWNIDPVIIPDVSPYLCLGSNPIRYNDILGNVWGRPGDKKENADKRQADKLKSEYTQKHAEFSNAYNEITSQIAELSKAGKEVPADLISSAHDANAGMINMEDAIKDIDAIDKDANYYTFQQTANNEAGRGNLLEAEKNNDGTFTIIINYERLDNAQKSHEVSHAADIANKLYSPLFGEGKTYTDKFNGVDERAAYMRQYFYDRTSMSSVKSWKELKDINQYLLKLNEKHGKEIYRVH